MPKRALVLAIVGLAFAAPVLAQSPSRMMQKTAGEFQRRGPLDKVLPALAESAGVELRVEWDVLQDADVSRKSRVILPRSEATYAQLLDLTLAQVAADGKPLAWHTDRGRIAVTTRNRLNMPTTRPASAAGAVPVSDAGRPSRAISKPAPIDVDFRDVSAEAVFDYLRKELGLNLHVNWKALEVVGVDQKTPVTITVNQVKPAQLLDLLANELSETRGKMDRVYWLIEDGVLTFSTGSELNRDLKTVVIDVSDLLMIVPDFPGPGLNLNGSSRRGGNNSDDDGSIWGDSDDDDDDDSGSELNRAELRQHKKDTLIGAIKDSIGQDMWQPTGRGSIRFLGSRLVISQTRLGFRLLNSRTVRQQ